MDFKLGKEAHWSSNQPEGVQPLVDGPLELAWDFLVFQKRLPYHAPPHPDCQNWIAPWWTWHAECNGTDSAYWSSSAIDQIPKHATMTFGSLKGILCWRPSF
jgi:hypothetical protein